MLHLARLFAVVIVIVPTTVASVHAAVNDHLKCYRVKDALSLAAVVDLSSPQFGLEAGCKVSKAKLFCVPATKTVVSAEDKKTHVPITPLPVGGPDPGDRVCYKVKCPEPFPPDTQVTDQFGTRTVTKFKTSMLCTPAFKGSTRFVDNGDGTVTDNYTALQWEKKVAGSGCLHCVNDIKVWTTAMDEWISEVNGYSVDGTAQTGLGGYSDWRMPTNPELQTILLAPYPCGTSPCIDPVFGPTAAADYWSSTTDLTYSGDAWEVYFVNGYLDVEGKYNNFHVRAVRGG